MATVNRLCVVIFLFGLLYEYSLAIDCYRCSGSDPTKPFQCNEWLTSDIDITPETCDDVYDAKYCIKHTGRFEAEGINCYQCSSQKSMDCSDGMIQMGGIEPENCDHVFEAEYCVKSYSLEGGIGTKRFCSSLDLGNYCNYVKQPGDSLEYHTCVYTCSGDGCNPATMKNSNTFLILTIASFVLIATTNIIIRLK